MTDEQKANVTTADNPFHGQPSGVNAGTVAVEQTRAVAEVQTKLLAAQAAPRNKAAAVERILESCKRPTFAESAMYSYPRGGQTVTGASIRLAEELARGWGNILYGIKELSTMPERFVDGKRLPPCTEMQAFCWDLETNTESTQNFTVPHERLTRNGVRQLTDPRDIYELCANQGGRRVRARILAVIPPDVVEAAIKQVYSTLSGGAEIPLADRVNAMIQKFNSIGISQNHLAQRLGKPLDSILPEEIVEFGSIFNSIKDGQSKAGDFFGGLSLGENQSESAQSAQKTFGGNDDAPVKQKKKKKKEKEEAKAVTDAPVETEKTIVEPDGQKADAAASPDFDDDITI